MSYENIQTLQVWGNNESSNHSFSGMNRPGGVMEVRVSSQPDQGELIDARRGVSIQAGLGGVTTTTAGRTVSAPAVSTVHSSEFSGGHSDFLATARNNGIPAMGRLTPSSVVQYQGMEVDLATLEAIGVVRQSGNGYESVGGGNNEVQQGQQQVPQGNQAGVELFPDTVESAVADAIAPVPQHLYDQAIAVALESGLDAVGWAEIAYQSGITPEEARQRAEFVVQAFSMQADQIAKSNGIETPSEVWEWASRSASHSLLMHTASLPLVAALPHCAHWSMNTSPRFPRLLKHCRKLDLLFAPTQAVRLSST